MPHDKLEDLIRNFTRDIEALVRAELHEEITRAVEACLSGLAGAPRARRAARAGGSRTTEPREALPEPTVAAAPPAVEKRRGWTREAVVSELATWLLTGTVIEASFLTRHGKPGLVAAARKHFGRFDAALNAANVQLARQHPAGPPTANRRPASAGARSGALPAAPTPRPPTE